MNYESLADRKENEIKIENTAKIWNTSNKFPREYGSRYSKF